MLDGLRISNSQVKRLERELKNLKEEVGIFLGFRMMRWNNLTERRSPQYIFILL
jgi:hypothetical protein